MDKEQGSTMHKELYLISLGKPYGRDYKKEHIYVHTQSLCHTAEINRTL